MECSECRTSLQSEWAYCPICGYKKPETVRPSEGSSLNSNRDKYRKKGKKRKPRFTRIDKWCCYSCGYTSPEESGEKYCPNCDCYISEYGMKEGETPVCPSCMDSDDVIPAGVRSKQYYCRKHGYSDTRCTADEFGIIPDECWSDIDGKNFNRYAGAEYVCTHCKITVKKGCRNTVEDMDYSVLDPSKWCHCKWKDNRPRKRKKRQKQRRMSAEDLFADWDLDGDY